MTTHAPAGRPRPDITCGGLHGRRRSRSLAAGLALAATACLGPGGQAAGGEADRPLHLLLDRAHLLAVREPLVTIAVSNPAVADVHVVAPDQVLVLGRAVGATSLVLFHGRRSEQWEVVVHPAPVDRTRTGVHVDAPHAVVVMRADRTARQVFARDAFDDAWVELGASRPEPAPGAGK